ncbi:MAG: type II secretion system protein M [Lachnospiraceae bacterium]|nr:type II secretion system protein M [Lachnospiraceae bacterium]
MATGITARDKKLLYMLGLIVIAALFFIIGIRPLNRKINSIEEKIDDAQVLHDSIKMKIMQLDMIEEFKSNAEKMTDELSSRYYERQMAADVDRLVTNKALGYGLKVNNFSIQSPKDPVVLLAYVNSEAWAAKQKAIEAAQYVLEEEEAADEDTAANAKSDKNDKDNVEDTEDSSTTKASDGMVDIEALASINNEDGMYNIEDTTPADVYAASLMLDVYGDHGKVQALLDEIITNKAFRVTSYEWTDLTSLPFEYVNGELVQVAEESGNRLIVNFEMYMYDGSAFKDLTEGKVEAGSSDESGEEATETIVD